MLKASPNRLLTWAVTAIVVCAFLLVDFITPFAFVPWQSIWLPASLIGVCIGQLNLLAAWVALAPGNVMLRLPWTLLVSVLSWYALVLGNRAAERPLYLGQHYSLGEALLLGITLLVGVIAAQIPLWLASRGLGFRLVQGAHSSAARGNQFQLRHILLGMLLLCVALAPLRVVLPHDDHFAMPAYLDQIFVLVTAAVVCNLLITLPCLWGAFLRPRMFLLVAMAWPFYAALLTSVATSVLYAVPGDSEIEQTLPAFLVNLTQCVTVTGVLLIFRAIGFRLVRVGRQKLPPADAVQA